MKKDKDTSISSGNISINTENILPIVKRFLYSDQEIFVREIISNAIDATNKIQYLSSINEHDKDTNNLKIKVNINKNLKTIIISDNGIGMTENEVKKYINQIAFSGAKEFLEKYKDKPDKDDIIGFFGLGFYSCFMVSDKVEIVTKSYKKSKSIMWRSKGTKKFEILEASKKEIGTDIIMHISKSSEEFLEKNKIKKIIEKYCKFTKHKIELNGEVINNTNPIWNKNPNELKDEDYTRFYKELYPLSEKPIFWIHLNVDYPFKLTGILYFPKIKQDLDQNKNKIKLYSKEIFITDEIKNIVPEFLTLLHGVIDSPDIPLNVSRSYLQANENIKKINSYITKKTSDKLEEIFNENRKEYENRWKEIEIFVKYGMITEEKFYEKAKKWALLKNIENEYFTIEEYQEKIKKNQTDKNGNIIILYSDNPEKKDIYIQSCKRANYDVIIFNNPIDNHFIEILEKKSEKLNIKSIDSDTIDNLIKKNKENKDALSNEEKDELKSIYKELINNENITFNVVPMNSEEFPITITIPEFIKRIKHTKQYNQTENNSEQLNININSNHPISAKIIKNKKKEYRTKTVNQIYNLLLLSQNMLKGKELTKFIQSNIESIN